MQDLVYINQLLLQEINQLRSVIDCLPGAIYWKNLSGKYMGRNTAAKQSMLDKGFGECEVIGLFWRAVHHAFAESFAVYRFDLWV